MKKIVKIFWLLMLGIILLGGLGEVPLHAASKGIKISKKNFPDKYFREAIKKYYDSDKDGYLSSDDSDLVFEIVHEPGHLLFGKNKKQWKKKHSLKGIEYFTNLTKIEIHDVNIGNPNVKENRYLESICLYGTNTTFINIKSNPNLKKLHIIPKEDPSWKKRNPLKNINVSNNKKLEELLLPNGISKIDVRNLEKLKHLHLGGGALESLDLSNNKELVTLDCSGNKLAELDLSNNSNLTVLLCENNQMKQLTLPEEPCFFWFQCFGNNLTRVDMKQGTVTGTFKFDPGTIF